jgi:putative transposase
MILTYKVRHNRDFSSELAKARQIAEFAIMNRDKLSSKYVKHIGLKSAVANQLLRKYGRDRRCRRVSRVKLIVPGQGIRFDREAKTITIPCLSLTVPYGFGREFETINQIEADNRYLYVSVTVREEPPMETEDALGVDLNATGHVAVIAVPKTGKVAKLGKKAEHVHKKYSRLRRRFQKQGKLRKLKQVKRRESRIVRDLNHKVSRKIVSLARKNQCRIQMEDLSGIRQRAKTARSFRYGLNSWSFYQLRLFVEYKANLQGVPVSFVDPRYTSKECSRCGLKGERSDKRFKCPHCGHVAHADVNAAFNVALRPESMERSIGDSDPMDGSADTPRGATSLKALDSRTPLL